MAQPYDYSGAFSRVNPIQVAQGLQGLQAGAEQLQQNRQQREGKEAFKMGLEALDFNNPDAVQQFAQQNPDQIEAIKSQQQFSQQQQLAPIADAAQETFQAALTGNPDIMKAAIDNNAELFNTVDPSIDAEAMKRIVDVNPELIKNMMAGALSQAGRGDFINNAIGLSAQTPHAVQENMHYLGLSQEDKEDVLRYKGRGGPDLATKNDLNRANDILKNPAIYTDGEVQWAQGITNSAQPIAESLYGGLSSSEANKYMFGMEDANASHSQLSRQRNLLMDMQDKDISLKGAGAGNFMQSWFGEVLGVDQSEAGDYSAAVMSGNFDIARQLAQTLRPVSEKQLELVLKSLKGGNVSAAIQAINGTMKQVESDYTKNRNVLRRNRAGIVDDPELPESLEFVRSGNVIASERYRPPGTPQPGAEDDTAVADAGGQAPPTQPGTVQPPQQPPQPGQTEAPRPFAQTSDDDLARSLGISISVGRRLSNIEIGDY